MISMGDPQYVYRPRTTEQRLHARRRQLMRLYAPEEVERRMAAPLPASIEEREAAKRERQRQREERAQELALNYAARALANLIPGEIRKWLAEYEATEAQIDALIERRAQIGKLIASLKRLQEYYPDPASAASVSAKPGQ